MIAEVSIVLLIFYGVLWWIGPGVDLYLPPRGPCGGGLIKAKQKRTLADIRNTGTAFMSFLNENKVPETTPFESTDSDPIAAPAGSVDVGGYRLASYDEIFGLLHPRDDFFFMQAVPDIDGWKQPLEFRLAGDPTSPTGLVIRSPGCDGEYEQDTYEIGPFISTDYRRDIVWADGSFLRWPGR